MLFNNKKFQAIRFFDLLNPPEYTALDGTRIADHTNVKDLGIHMSRDLTFDYHIREVALKGKRVAGWILRVFKTREKDTMLTLLKQVIYPTLEYCCVLWSPTNPALINVLESVQRNFVRRIDFGHNRELDYWDRLASLKLYSLERRRERYLILYTWKVLKGLYPNPGLLLNTVLHNQHATHPNTGIGFARYNDRTGVLLSHAQGDNTRINKLSILSKCCDLFNALPSHLRQLTPDPDPPCLINFKKDLDAWLLTLPDQPQIQTRHRPAPSNSIIHQRHYRR